MEDPDPLEMNAPPREFPARADVDAADDVDLAGDERLTIGHQAVGHCVDADDALTDLEVRLGIAEPDQWRRPCAGFLLAL